MRPLTGTNRFEATPPALSSGIGSVSVFVWVVGGPGRPVGIVTGTGCVPPSVLVTSSMPVASTPQVALVESMPSKSVVFCCSVSAVMSG